MAKMTRANFGQLLTPIHKKVFFESYGEKEEQYSKVFKVEDMDKAEVTFPHMGAFGLWNENTEGNLINQDDISEGDTATFVPKRFDKGYEVTWELVRDDKYNVMKGIGKGGSAKGLGRSLRATIETEAANILNNGFVNVGYDGKPLFANDHPLADHLTAVLDNLLTGALNDANLKLALTMIRNQVDEANVKIQAVGKNLVVGADNEFNAKAIVKSTQVSGSQLNDTNTVPDLSIQVLDYVTGAKWFVQDPTIDNLILMFRDKPFFDSEKLEKTVDYHMFGYTRFATGYSDFRGLVGSLGV